MPHQEEDMTKSPRIPSSQITPESVYLSRRRFLRVLGAGTAGAALLAACRTAGLPTPTLPPEATGATLPIPTGGGTDEYGTLLTSEQDVTHYNNYYEFSTSKSGIDGLSKDLVLEPWKVEVSGLVHQPRTYDIDDLVTRFDSQERIYRMRCVEGWSMVIPWEGFQLSRLIDEVEPMTSAGYIRFVSLFDPTQMAGQNSTFFPWPYEEGLRMDEARHELTLMATGLYGKSMPPQNGAPLRLVVPWKYGYKSAKAIVKIEFTEQQPATFWNRIAPDNYGFYSNVLPSVASFQSTERRIGESGRVQTQPYNGYEGWVSGLYAGMEQKVNS
jgi:sulfoxide reductase catalytic subunit YedY